TRLSELAPVTFISLSEILKGSGWRAICRAVERSDIVHLHTLWSPTNALVALQCRRRDRPYVVMPHGMLDPYSLSVRRWRKSLYLRAVERPTIAAARRMIYTTAEEARLASSQHFLLPPGVVIPLGGDAPNSNGDAFAASFLDKFPEAKGRLRVLFLG